MAELFDILSDLRDEKELVIYCLVRTDLPSMNPGKAMAQTLHAGNQILKHSGRELVQEYLRRAEHEGGDGFGVCITLGATLGQIEAVERFLDAAPPQLAIFERVIDPSYPFWVDVEIVPFLDDRVYATGVVRDGKALCQRSETTCAWLLGDRKNPVFRASVLQLDLMP